VSAPLYTLEILRLAGQSARFERIEHPDATVERRSPTCGSRVTIDMVFDDDRKVKAIGGDIRACAFGQAAAAMLHDFVQGQSAADLEGVLVALRLYLQGKSDAVDALPGLAAFERARLHPGRHAAILLPFEAAVQAAQMAGD
jgi:NifU-like protein involved in Fe-S cluster formation